MQTNMQMNVQMNMQKLHTPLRRSIAKHAKEYRNRFYRSKPIENVVTYNSRINVDT